MDEPRASATTQHDREPAAVPPSGDKAHPAEEPDRTGSNAPDVTAGTDDDGWVPL